MKLLLDERNLIVAIGSNIEYGVWGNVKSAASWRINPTYYMMDGNFHLVDIGDTEIPTYVKENQYYYVDGEFKLSDECPNEYKDKINEVEETVDGAVEAITVIEDATCETEIMTDERIAALEEAICELSILLESEEK